MILSARQAAFNTLLRIEKERSYAEILINRELLTGALRGPERGLYTELVYGTLRRQGNLDHVIAQFSHTQVTRLERSVLLLLRLGLYQLLYLDRIPASAAVNETVKLAKQLAPKAAGFVNAVLRNTDRKRNDIRYPDPDKEPAAYLAARHSHPRWIVDDWLSQLGFAETAELAAVMATPPPFTIRANRLRTDRELLQQRLASENAPSTPCRYAPDGLVFTASVSLPSLPSFAAGLFTVQDEASQLAALLLAPRAGDTMLDLCAAPGGKATYLAELTGDQGTLRACDRNPRKLELISEAAARLGLTSIAVTALDAGKSLTPLGEELFDRVLVDAPCTGLGVIHRNPDGKWWKEPADPARLATTQAAIIRQAATRLKPGGVLVYSTCSTTIVENEQVVDNFLNEHPDFMVEPVSSVLPQIAELETSRGFFRSWPHRHGMDGFFAARLTKRQQESAR